MKDKCTFTWFGQTWKVIRSKKSSSFFGGECDMSERVISINARYNEDKFLDYLHHELMEGAIYLNACSYTKFYPDKEDIVVMNHSQMDVVSGTVRGAYEEIKKNIDVAAKETDNVDKEIEKALRNKRAAKGKTVKRKNS